MTLEKIINVINDTYNKHFVCNAQLIDVSKTIKACKKYIIEVWEVKENNELLFSCESPIFNITVHSNLIDGIKEDVQIDVILKLTNYVYRNK